MLIRWICNDGGITEIRVKSWSSFPGVCVCVCVCERERERERDGSGLGVAAMFCNFCIQK